MKIANPIHFGLRTALRPLVNSAHQQPAFLGELRQDVFQMQPVRFGEEISPKTGEKIQEWLALLSTLGSQPNEAQCVQIQKIAEELKNTLTIKRKWGTGSNHILAFVELYGDTDPNPYRVVAQSSEAREIASRITERQLHILELSALGWKRTTIAKALGVSPRTVTNTISMCQWVPSLFNSLNVQDMPAALSLATRYGLLSNRSLSSCKAIQRIEALTLTQLRVLELALSDNTPKKIGVTLGIALKTVRNHENAIYKSLLPNQLGSRRVLITQYYDYLEEIQRLIKEKSTK